MESRSRDEERFEKTEDMMEFSFFCSAVGMTWATSSGLTHQDLSFSWGPCWIFVLRPGCLSPAVSFQCLLPCHHSSLCSPLAISWLPFKIFSCMSSSSHMPSMVEILQAGPSWQWLRLAGCWFPLSQIVSFILCCSHHICDTPLRHLWSDRSNPFSFAFLSPSIKTASNSCGRSQSYF